MANAWEKAVREYKSSGGGNQKSSGSSGGSAWQKAVDEYKQYDRDAYRSMGQQRTSQRKEQERQFEFENTFNNEANAFFSAARRDLTTENGFNAADFFEERKRQADALKKKAETIALYLNDHMDSYTPESYDSNMQYLSQFNTQVDDILAQYQPSIDAKTGMRAYEDELRAAMEHNEQLGKIDRMVDYAFEPGSPSANFMQQFRQYQNDNSYLNVTDDWTEEERYNLGLLSMENPAEAQKYAEQVNNYHNAQATEQRRQQIRDQATGDIWGNTGRALLASMMGAGDLIDRAAENAARGRTTEKNYLTATDYANETTGAINEYLNNRYGTVDTSGFQNLRDIGQQGLRDAGVDASYVDGAGNGLLDLARDMVDQKGVGDVYNFGYSLAQNLASRYTLGMVGGQPLVLANYFANAATSAIDDARRKGATGNQAYAIGMIKGALEVGTEFIPTKKLFEMGPAVTVGDFLKDLGVEALEEFVGEGANALGGYIADKKIMGDLSEFETAKRNYMEQGMTEEHAHAMAIKDAVANIAFEGLSGALSGAISGGTESAVKTMQMNQLYRNVNPQPLIEEGMAADSGSDAYRIAEQMQQRIDDGKKPSGSQKYGLITELQKLAAQKVDAEMAAANMTAEQIEEMKPTTSDSGNARLISKNMPVDVQEFAEVKDGKATVKLKEGTAEYQDISFGTEKQGNQYFAVESLPLLDTAHANKLLHTIQEADAGKDTTEVMAIREAYRLGYMGATTQELRGSDANVLPTNLQDQIYSIGQEQRTANDAVRSTVKAIPTKATGKYKKVVIEGKLSKLNGKRKAEIAYMDRVADEFAGTAVHVYESYKKNGKMYYRDNSGKEQLAPHGKYVNGEIWVDLNSGDKGEGLVLNTFAHEMYHHIEEWNKPKARELAEFVVKELGLESVDKAVQKQIDKARAAGYGEEHFKGMTPEQARNEVYMRAMSDFVADSLETMFTRGDPAKAIANLKKENQGLFDQIKAFIDEWISKVKKFYGYKTISQEGAVVAQLEKFEQLQQLFMEAMQGAGENYQAAEVVDEKSTTKKEYAKFSYAGRVALTADESALKRAEELAEKGVDNESIRQQTGWFMGRDGKWRFEIDDSNMRVDPHGDIRGAVSYKWAVEDMESAKDDLFGSADLETLNNVRAYNRAILANDTAEKNRLYNQLINGQHAYRFRQYAEAREHVKELSQKFGGVLRPGSQLGDYVQHDALFEAYPQLQSASFRFGKLPSGTRGQYNPADNSIIISNEIADSPERTIIHEIQHAIQKVEGFASGASPEYWEERQRSADSIGVYDHKIDAQMKRVDEILGSLPTDVADEFRDWSALYKQNETAGMVRAQELSDGQYGKQFNDYFMTTWDLEELLKYNHKRGSSDLYRNTAGEIEARDTANRLQAGLNAEGRKNTPPDLGDDRTVFADGKAPVNDYIPGDISDNELETGINEVADMSPIASISGKEFTTEGRTLLDDVDRFFKSIGGQVYNARLGDINLTRRGVKDSLAHGMTPEKASAFAAIPNVLQEGKVVGFEKNWKSRGYDSATIAAPITISGEEYLMAVIVHRSNSANRFYVHDVFTIKKEATPFMTGTQNLGEPGGATSTISIIRKILAVKRNRNNAAEKLSLRNQQPTTREILSQIDISTRKKTEAHFLGQYQENLSNLAEQEPRLAELNAQIKELYKDQKGNLKEITRLQKEQRQVNADVNRLKGLVNAFERSDMGKRLVSEYKLKEQKRQAKETRKDFKAEQKELIQTMQAEQRAILEELTGKISDITLMEREFIRLAKKYEQLDTRTGKSSIKDAKTIAQLKADLKAEAKSHKEDSKIWEREFNRLLTDYETAGRQIARLEATISRQRADAKAKITQVRETQEVQKQRKHVEDNAKKLMRILTNPTKDAHAPMALQEPLQKFLDSIDFTSNRYASGGSATIKDRSYINALAKVRDAIKGQRTALTTEDGVFTLDVPPEFTEEIDKHINMVSDATEGLDLTTNRIYEMTSAELKDLNYILNTINKAIRDIDRMHMQGEKARTSGLARDTMQEMQNRKPIKGEKGNWFVWNNYTPFHAFRRYGKAAMKIFDGLKAGQAKLARTIDSVVKFTEKTYTAKEVKEWEHNRHEIKLDSGKTVTMSSAQIMTFWCLSHRDQAIPHMQGAGIRMTTLEKFVGKANTQKELVQKDHFSLTLEDVNRINQLLTDRQRTVAREMQQFMQNFGGKLVNEISMARWDFMAATEKDYFPIDTVETSRDVKNPDQKKTSLFALLNKSFTKAPVQNARNAMVIDSIFNVFAKHMSEVAEYNAFALPLVDTMKWFNYRENVDVGEGHIHDVGVNRSIRDTLGTEAIQYFVDLMTDINSSQKAGRHEDFFGKILGRSKAASVAWNTRVAIQQISALPRASMILNYKSLIKGASKVRLKYATQEMMKYSGIALWKSMGYYDLNVGKSVERQIKGDTSIVDKFNEVGMWLPGKMDERTWARIWIATKDQVQNTTHLTGEDLLQATAKKFEEVVYETQVVDSVLTKSSFMRDKNLFIKEATSFMAEPTLAINILMSAFQDYEEGHSRSEKVKRGLMIGFTGYALAGVVNALLGSFSDAWRDDDEFEDYWEKYRQALFGEKFFDGNLFSELNPIEKIAFVKDVLSVAKGNEPHSTYSKLMTDAVNLINSYQSIADGKGSKTVYGVVYQTLQYLSTASGVGMSNMTREVIDIWNNTIGKINPEQRILRYKPDNGDELLNAIQNGTEEDIQRVFGRFENQQKAESALQSAIRAKYVAGEMTAEEAEDLLTTNFDRDDEHEVYWILEEWNYAKENGNTEGYTKYGTFFEAIDSGEDYTTEMDRLMAHGAEASDIQRQISRKYRKQYLEDETAREEIREKLRPVYEATGMYADDIEDKFNDWDFEAEYGMTYGEFKAEYREGLVTETQMREAMKSYGLMQYEIAEGIRELNDEIKFMNKYDMTLTEMKDAYDHGDISPNQMRAALVFDGMTQKEAREWVAERDIENRLGIEYAKLDDAYKHGDISRTTLRNAIIEHGETPEKADEAMMGYDWLKKNVKKYPDLTISDGKKFAVRIHSDYAPDETLEDYGVSIDAYIEYQRMRPECKGVDANGDGKTDDGTLRDSIFQMIDSLPINSEAKDGLALMSYSAKSIRRNAPWHK